MKWSNEDEKYVPSSMEQDLNSGLCDSRAWPTNHIFLPLDLSSKGPLYSSTAPPWTGYLPVVLPAFSFLTLVSTGLTSGIWNEKWWSIGMCACYCEVLGACPGPVSLTFLLRTLTGTFAWANACKAWLSKDLTPPNLSVGPLWVSLESRPGVSKLWPAS